MGLTDEELYEGFNKKQGRVLYPTYSCLPIKIYSALSFYKIIRFVTNQGTTRLGVKPNVVDLRNFLSRKLPSPGRRGWGRGRKCLTININFCCQ
ncbi:hypothetical protein ACFL6W_07235 [Thermodesulfobacteriota bacterium]